MLKDVTALNEPELVVVKVNLRPIEKAEEVKPPIEEVVAAARAVPVEATGETQE